MNTYYTTKDIEKLAASGTKELVLGPDIFLTDYARVTAQQLGVALVKNSDQAAASKPAASRPQVPTASSKYNKPAGCQHASNASSTAQAQAAVPSNQSSNAASSTAVNKLVGLMGKVIKRGR